MRAYPSFDAIATPLDPGTTLVEASAGAGKTHALTRVVLRLVLEGHASSLGRVLVVTFTNAATAELAGRVRETLAAAARVFAGEADGPLDLVELANRHGAPGLQRVRAALAQADELAVTTIHGFCKRTLEQAAFACGMPFAAEFVQDDRALVEEAAWDAWRQRTWSDPLAAEAAAALGLSPLALVGEWRRLRAHADPVVVPVADTLDVALARVRVAADALAANWDEAAVRRLFSGARWNAKAPLAGSGLDDACRACGALAGGSHAGALTAVAAFHPDALRAALHKTRHPQLPSHPALDACAALADAVQAVLPAWRGEVVAEIDRRYAEAKRQRHVLAFDDLLRRLRDALVGPGGSRLAAEISGHYDAALVDEFQDTDPVQCAILARVFARARLLLVGDPKQAIYAFRGADVATYLAVRDGADRVFGLDRNWRSSTALVAALNALWARPQRPFLEARIAFHPATAAGTADVSALHGDGGAPLRWWWLAGDGSKERAATALNVAIAAETVRLLHGAATLGDPRRRLRPHDIAVLVRTNREGQAVQAALRAVGVPGTIAGTGDVLASDVAEELARVLAAIADPADAGAVRAALATGLWGADAAAIRAFDADETGWEQLLMQLDGWRHLWLRHGVVAALGRAGEERDWTRRLLGFAGGERRLTDLRHVSELLHEAEAEGHRSPAGLLAWLARARTGGVDLERERRELRLESDAEAVQIVTCHKAKGLEYEIVFCPSLWAVRADGDMPAVAHDASGRLVFDWGSPDHAAHAARAAAETLAEQLRLTYVALTRARQRCYVAWGDLPGAEASPLAYLLHQPATIATGEPAAWAAEVQAAALAAKPAWRDQLEAFASAHPALMAVEVAPMATAARWRSTPDSGPSLAARQGDFAPDRFAPWRIASFTALVRGVGDDALADRADPSSPAETVSATGIFAVAKGARAGIALHAAIEHLDWATPVQANAIRARLARHGLAGAGDADPAPAVATALERLRSEPIPGAGFALEAVAREARWAEWPFHLALGELRPPRLGEALRRHGSARVARDYAPLLAGLDQRTLHGLLAGVIDLVFVHAGRWWIADWKSNHLGNRSEDYGEATLWRAMCEHHYVLQSHLYLVALHRHLGLRLPGYDYERDVGGACYVFLRGLDGSGNGWWVERPPRAVIEALDQVLAGEPSLGARA